MANPRSFLTLLLLLGSPIVPAIDIEPGAYTAFPPGKRTLAIGLQRVSRDARYADGVRLPGNVELDTDAVRVRYQHYMQAGDYTIAPGFIANCGTTRAGGAIAALGKAEGCADPLVGVVFWAINRPVEKRYFAITPYLSVPVGQYDRNRSLNLGEHRWKVGLNSGYLTPLPGQFLLSLVGDIVWHGTNEAYLGDSRLEQDAIVNIQLHLRYPINPATQLSFSYLHDWGGETSVNTVPQDDPKNQGRFRIGAAHFITSDQQLQLDAGADTQVKNGFKENARVTLRYVWLY